MCKSLLFLVLFIHLDFRHRPGREQNYGNPNWDIRNRFVAIALYKLATLTGHNYALRTVSCGWQANLILTLLSGMAFKVGLSSDVANVGVGTQRPNFVYRGTNTCSRDTIVRVAAPPIASTPPPMPSRQYTFGNYTAPIDTGGDGNRERLHTQKLSHPRKPSNPAPCRSLQSLQPTPTRQS